MRFFKKKRKKKTTNNVQPIAKTTQSITNGARPTGGIEFPPSFKARLRKERKKNVNQKKIKIKIKKIV